MKKEEFINQIKKISDLPNNEDIMIGVKDKITGLIIYIDAEYFVIKTKQQIDRQDQLTHRIIK